MLTLFRRFVRLALVALSTVVIFLLLVQCRLMYYPRPYGDADLKRMQNLGGERIEVITAQGRQTAHYLPAEGSNRDAPEFLWWVFGGNGSLALDYLDHVRGWDPRFAFVFVDYPGYGLCEGNPSPSRIADSIEQFSKQLTQRFRWTGEERRQRSGVLGHSLGCAAALIAAEKQKMDRVVLCAPFTSMTDMGRQLLGWPLCHLNLHRYDNGARLKNLPADARVIVFHGVQDEVIPVKMSQQLAAQFPDLIQLHEIPEARHNDVVLLANDRIGLAMRGMAASKTPLNSADVEER
ncbi:lysophospholipase [Phragmitibacter flavus]|uniref:Lysophospholipase n=1 Tax=Phragmitibacter flavus TaxID=2576071 RepID=A0A5R8KJS4_9BACT|nr:alpha/beta hydrolase [Phragmitibacter flavus]TLD72501.1 lysophospholipase [Phragmitibacter flavus]